MTFDGFPTFWRIFNAHVVAVFTATSVTAASVSSNLVAIIGTSQGDIIKVSSA